MPCLSELEIIRSNVYLFRFEKALGETFQPKASLPSPLSLSLAASHPHSSCLYILPPHTPAFYSHTRSPTRSRTHLHARTKPEHTPTATRAENSKANIHKSALDEISISKKSFTNTITTNGALGAAQRGRACVRERERGRESKRGVRKEKERARDE